VACTAIVLAAVLGVVLAGVVEASAGPVVMRIQHVAPLDHQITLSLHAFALDVAARTNGEVMVDVVTKPRSVVTTPLAAAVRDGALEAACVPTFVWGRDIPELDFTLIPYYFTSLDAMRRFPASAAAKAVEQRLNALGVRTLTWMDVTRISLITSNMRPIVSPADFAGLRIRTVSEFGKIPFAAVGAIPVVTDAGNVSKAIRDGQLGAVLTDLSSAVGLALYDVQKFGTVAPYFSAYYHLFVNPSWMNHLAPAHKRAVEEAAAALEQTAFTITEARAAASLDILCARGMTLHTQTDEERLAWRAAMQPAALEAYVKAGPDRARFLTLLPK
jgi:C4-dicarboxylate-binding protein DctP